MMSRSALVTSEGERMNRRRLTVAIGAMLTGIALVPLLAAPAGAIPANGSKTYTANGGTLKVAWRGACNVDIGPHAMEGTWSPTLNLRVVETGQTPWTAVKLAYKYREFGETFIVAREIGDISAADAVFNPPKHDFGSGDIQRSDDTWGVGFRISVSTDGTNFTLLDAPSLLDCTPSF